MAKARPSVIGLGLLRAILWPLPVLALAAITLLMRLAAGPVDVPVPERALDALMAHALPGWRVAVSGAEFDLFGTDGLTGLKLRDMRLLDPAGNEATAIPELGLTMALSLSAARAEAVRIRGVRIAGAQVDMTRRADGGLSFGFDGLFGPSDGGAGLSFDDLFAAEGKASVLPVIALSDVRLDYRDEARDIALTAHGSTVVFDPAGTVSLDGIVETAGGESMRLDIEGVRLTDGTIAVDIVFDDAFPPALAAIDPLLARLDTVTMPLRGSGRARLGTDGAVMAASATLRTTGPGTLTAAGRDWPVARLAVDLAYTPESLRADFHEIALEGDGMSLAASAGVERGGDGAWTLTAEAPAVVYVAPDGSQTVETGPVSLAGTFRAGQVTVEDFTVRNPALNMPRDGKVARATVLEIAGRIDTAKKTADFSRVMLAGLNATVDGRAFGADLLEASATIAPHSATLREWSARAITIDDGKAVVMLAKAGGATHIDRTTGRAQLDALSLKGIRAALPDGVVVVAPSLVATGSVDPRAGRIALATVRIPGASLALPSRYAGPLSLDVLTFALDATARSVDIHDLAGRVHGVPVEGRLAVELGGVPPRTQVALKVTKTDIARVAALWPPGTLKGARKWVTGNVHSAAITGLSLDARLGAARPEDDALDLAFDFAGADITAIPGMPPLRRARGRGRVTLDGLEIAIDAAQVPVPGAPGFALGASRFAIPDFSPDPPVGQLTLDVTGPAQSILRFLDHEPLALVRKSGLDIDAVTGSVSGTVMARLPLGSGVKIGDIDYRADATLRAFALPEPHTGVRIEGDTMSAKVTPGEMTLRADARIDGLAARVEYDHRFAEIRAGQPEGVLTLQSYLTREDFALRAGVDIGDYFDGVAVVDAKVDLYRGGGARATMSADLTGSTLRLDRLGWVKTDGVPVTVEAKGFRNPDGAGRIEQLTVRGSGIAARGRIEFAPGGGLHSVDLDRVVLADLLDAGLHYGAGDGASPRRVDIAGAYLDLGRPFSDALDASGRQDAGEPDAEGGPPMEIALRLARMRLRDGLDIVDLDGRLQLADGGLVAARLDGRLNGSAAARLLAERREGGLALRLTAPDAGAFLEAASVFEGATGGALLLDARTSDATTPPRIAGMVRADGITIRDSRTMRRILSGGAVGSLMQQMVARGLSFKKVALPFSGTGGRWTIADGVAWGDALGLTLDGTYDIDRKGIDLTGTVSPAYAINGALGSVPLLGTLLTGGEGEGMFGITFAVRGSTDDPAVWVNPLSAIAPGFLRKIVSGVMDGPRVADVNANTNADVARRLSFGSAER